MEALEQLAHDLNVKMRRVTEERDLVLVENEELQEKLSQVCSDTQRSVAPAKLQQLQQDMDKMGEEVSRLEQWVSKQHDEMDSLTERMADVAHLKQSVQELTEDLKMLKEDSTRMQTHLNVAAKLELQTQEKMYENRLYHLENVLEEMRQREALFMHLAEETALLKDQVDALRELSVVSMRHEAGLTDQQVEHLVPFSFSTSNEDAQKSAAATTLDKEMGPHKVDWPSSLMMANPNVASSPEEEELPEQPKLLAESASNGFKAERPDLDLEGASAESSVYDNVKLVLMQTHSKPSPDNAPVIKVSGTLKLTPKALPSMSDQPEEGKKPKQSQGCFPSCFSHIWGCFD